MFFVVVFALRYMYHNISVCILQVFLYFYYIQKVPQADSERLPKGTKIITIIQITEEVKEHPDSAD